jgi:SAM-dependent methyltransferase
MQDGSGAPKTIPQRQRMYSDLARWWPLLSPPSEYVEEAEDLVPMLRSAGDAPPRTLLELGSGGGSLAFHLKGEFELTLTDLSPAMLEVCRSVNPECEAITGDMRTLRLGRTFDAVLIHDAICYMLTEADLRAALETAAIHCRPGGGIVLLPDFVSETFVPGTDCDGKDASDGRGLRYLEWCWDADASDSTYEVAYAFMLREPDGSTSVVHDRHVEGLFSREEWLAWLADAGFEARAATDRFRSVVFTGRLIR